MARKGDHQGPGRISTLSEALQVTPDEARVVTLGYPPYQIVHTNKRKEPAATKTQLSRAACA